MNRRGPKDEASASRRRGLPRAGAWVMLVLVALGAAAHGAERRPTTRPAGRKGDFVRPTAAEALAFLRTLPTVWGGRDANGKVKWVQPWAARTVQDIKTMRTLHPGYHVRSGAAWRRREPVRPERKALPKFVGKMHTRLDPEDYRYFTAFERLEKFEMTHDLEDLTDECLFYLGRLAQSVHTIRLEMCEATGEGVRHLQNLKGLETLTMNLSRNITDAALLHAAGIASLKRLEVSSCPSITGSGVGALARVKGLKSLKIGSCSLRDASLVHFRRLSVETLDLSHTEMGWAIEYRGGGRANFTVTFAGLRDLLADRRNLPNLKRLILTTDPKIRRSLLTPSKLRISRKQMRELASLRPGLEVR